MVLTDLPEVPAPSSIPCEANRDTLTCVGKDPPPFPSKLKPPEHRHCGQVLPSISRNVSLNSSVSAMVSVVPLDWLRAEEGVRVLPGPPGLVIAADCVWLEELVEPFVRALEAATEAGGARVLMAYQSRSARIDDLLFGLLERTFSRSPVPLLPGEEGRGAIDLFSLTRKG